LLKKATEEAAKGTFTPIVHSLEKETEVDRLIEAFNEMAKRLEAKQEQLLQSRKMASIGTLTSGIAHELNNPINNISLSAESLLESGSGISNAEAKEVIEDILFQADRAGQVVKDLLEFSRTERPFLLKLSIKETLERTIKLIKNQIMVTGIQIEKDIPEDLPPIKGRRQDLQQAFINILLNAIQAMQDISKEHTISIRTGRGPEGYTRVDITDTGCGIQPKDIGYIFDPFFTTKEVGRGTGLGLSLAYSIIRTHGGYIEVKSKINKGTTFSIFLPTAIKNEEHTENSV
jgi:signal transduction histidine kinase